MTTSFEDELASINADMEAANEVFKRRGITEAELPVIDASDAELMAAVAKRQAASARLNVLLADQ